MKKKDDLICWTNSEPFRQYMKELRRHERALIAIYGKDKLHIHQPELIGSVGQVFPERRLLVQYYRCAVCLKDLTAAEVKKLKNKL